MHHFGHISPLVRSDLFHQEPAEFTSGSPAPVLAAALGATLYSPATRPQLADDVLKQAARGVVSMVLCLEDSIDDADVADGEANLVRQFAELDDRCGGPSGNADGVPLLFVRVREPEQIPDLVHRLGPSARLLSGFVLPKFTEERGTAFLEALTRAEAAGGRRLFAMPVLESPELLHLETRADSLAGIARTVDKYRDRILALRLGVTDFCSAYGLRRTPDMTAYDVQIVASIIGDVVNVLGRSDGTGFTITGPVWEYFRVQERMFKPQLRRSPFMEGRADQLRTTLIEHDLDGLLREIGLDRANGLLGKTCIHPSHVMPVHALSVVSHEEFSDARDIVRPDRDGGGVLRSAYTNKMNEVKPHRAWAERTLLRAEVFGVAREDIGFVELLTAGLSG
ncbi:HpcH/HpaI aldolase/citrate lyase family protein [Streptomyces sp. NBC_01020]|uniref:HpcH/HpaI aldolase/citrate lyase family protein n=1 Tax=unclassified Streptomyces TaxID=2593676 RepID=UPI00224CA7EE|nr:HpcH/HpaI aldolase/citrate lyase family protein [Streptomyces sp. NBC_01306]MCX4726833.1 HpcH/HpaI aldolase/citrate lyase family protein [Streptomyces sp. NBC_01306]WSV03874.1 HpcH/HpaI aldolase/citrate lyase family protein [Streptomyces sp. NBC_01020]WSX70030.1 HpcH/HpaI aldolase/citrate lyase family protein [Streptomyces sp. NBC_00932]